MQTAAIAYRVADFLKQHPPFQFMDEAELVALAARGRVKFHEADEYICWQSSPHTPFFYVIQQGSVSLWDETDHPATLRDIRGAGDSVGTERFSGSPVSLHSAKASSEVVLYALNAADLEPLLERYPQAAKYVAAYSSATAFYDAPGKRAQPHEMFVADLVREGAPILCPASTPICEAARLLSESGMQALALMEGSEMVALLSVADLLQWVSGGALNPEQPALHIAPKRPLTLEPHRLASDCVLAMAESHVSAAALTTDGTRHAAIQGIVTASRLTPAFGDHPITILEEVIRAPGVQSLRGLNARARAWILSSLADPSALDWLASWADLVNRRVLERLLHLTGQERPGQLFCFYGAAGRQELLTAVAPRIAVIGGTAESLEGAFAECGYLASEPVSGGTLEEWNLRFSAWIRDPILSRVYEKRPFFDLRPVHGPADLFSELEAHVRAELQSEPAFLRILANDCLSDLPPLTFFRDLVIEESGEQTDTFRIEKSALEPLADVARVFSLAAGSALGGSTRQRFEQARRLLPSQESIFRGASETMRVMLLHEACTGLRMGTSGAELPLAILSRQDRQVLKSGFRSIHNLLEFTAPCEWLEAL